MADPGEKESETGYGFCDFCGSTQGIDEVINHCGECGNCNNHCECDGIVNEFLAQAFILQKILAEEKFQEEYLFRNN